MFTPPQLSQRKQTLNKQAVGWWKQQCSAGPVDVVKEEIQHMNIKTVHGKVLQFILNREY